MDVSTVHDCLLLWRKKAWCLLKQVSCVVASAQVILQKSEVESMVHSPGDYILLSADKYEIKVKLMFLAASFFPQF